MTENHLTQRNRKTEGKLALGREPWTESRIQAESGLLAESEAYALRAADKLVKAQVPRQDIQILAKLVEGLGHLGVVTTLDKAAGEVLIQTTEGCWPDLRRALEHMPVELRFLTEETCRQDMSKPEKSLRYRQPPKGD
ncbi:Domain of unknown function (DUF4911) [Acididesulfobacillus acetoxydans]|uniref:Uncharacterized protein n=1 Tax=Acididesulfobacillus acetoxydans TaxID=1561005 RepID=A0A8S0X5E2_9FIRM|nr:DUF4911 domain-containing protein [Acididesulfobacillus acetoxydans]CAA7601560.1 Domain of unknown function (DUF4911) [Acididesulfobacillus acetoxydans]CEJ07047.1 Hypothetical protein DEACI_1503 [Acididesulfobacillus acetoxydans]